MRAKPVEPNTSHEQLPDTGDRPVLGMMLAICGMLILPGMDAIAKHIGQNGVMSPGQLTLLRFVVQAGLFGIWIVVFSGWQALRPKRFWVNALRGALLALASLFFFTAIKYMPLADAIAIFFIEPLILTALSFVVLRERFGWRRMVAIIVGFCGAMIVIRPSYSVFGAISLLPLVTATLFATYLLFNRIAGRVDTPNVMQFVSGVSGAVVLLIAVAIGDRLGIQDMAFSFPREAVWWWLVLAMGLCGMIGHLIIVNAFQMTPASLLAPFQYLEIVSAALLGWLFFGDFPDPVRWFGIAIIVSSGLFVFWREKSK